MKGAAEVPALPARPEALVGHPYAAFLGRMQKPGRYLGGEEQQIVKAGALKCRMVLAFPDLYEIGMSHLGTRILYDLVNGCEDLACERAFSPWEDMEAELRARQLPLVSLESYTPLHAFDVVGVSLQYELSYTNVLLNLELGGVALRSEDRDESAPIVIAGGPTATHPEPLAPFVDAFLVGEAEELLPTMLRTIGDLRGSGASREDILGALARLPGVYVPRFYDVAEEPRNGMWVVSGRNAAGVAADAPATIERVWVRDLSEYPFPRRFPVPFAEAIFDRASVEITRGCTEGCRFCQAGMIYRPVRERTPEEIVSAVIEGIDEAGFAETSLTALSTADVSCIDPLIKDLVPKLAERKVELGIASLRAYGLSDDMLDEVKRVGITGLTFAPEAGTQRMRDVINKNVSEEDILDSARRIFERGYDRMKLYFIMGLPTETDADVAGIVETGRRCREVARELGLRRPPSVTVSVSQHVPKPHTPFQWAAMDSMEDLRSKVDMLWPLAKRAKVSLKTHSVEESWLECLFARGDRRMADVLLTAYESGARFDGWKERFSFQRWIDALEQHGVQPELFTQTLPVDGRLPWSHIDIGLEPGFLADEWRKATKGRLSPPCGKPFGAQVHHRTVEAAIAETKRLVCYDCGVACDLTDMRDERLVALRTLQARPKPPTDVDPRAPDPLDALVADGESVVPANALAGRLARSNLADDHAFKANAEAPHSRLRLHFRKHGPMRFLGHLDLIRVFPRMFRRARIELAFTRGYNPQPRMTFAPAMPLGMVGEEEVVDIDLVLEDSDRDMLGEWTAQEREARAASLLGRIVEAAPPGVTPTRARLVGPGEQKLGKIVDGADYAVDLAGGDAPELQDPAGRLADALARDALVIERAATPKRNRRSKPKPAKSINVRDHLVAAEYDGEAQELRFRVEVGPQGGARPREVVEALLGEPVDDHRFRRLRLLHRSGGAWVPTSELGVVPKAPRGA